jgi:hypothetical protein
MGILVHEGRERHGGCETREDPNAAAAGRAQSAAQIVDRFDGDAPGENGGLERRRLGAGIT